MLSHCHCLQSFVIAASVCCTCLNFIFPFHEIWLLLKRPHVAKSNPWHWVCQLSLTVGLQPLPGAALKGGVTPPLTGLLTPHGLICHLGPDMFNRVHICFLAQWVVILLLPLHLFFCTKWHKFQVTEKHFDMFWEKGSQKMDSWFDNDGCISCLIPLFAVLCSEKMERSLEMTEKAVLKHCEKPTVCEFNDNYYCLSKVITDKLISKKMTCILYWLSQEVALLRGIDTLCHFGFFRKKLYLNTIVVPSRDTNVFMQTFTDNKQILKTCCYEFHLHIDQNGRWMVSSYL